MFDDLTGRIAARFPRVEKRRRARAFVLGLDLPPYLTDLMSWAIGSRHQTCSCPRSDDQRPARKGDDRTPPSYLFPGPRGGHPRRPNYADDFLTPAAEGSTRHARASAGRYTSPLNPGQASRSARASRRRLQRPATPAQVGGLRLGNIPIAYVVTLSDKQGRPERTPSRRYLCAPVSVGWLAAEEAPERLFGGARASAALGLGPVRLAARGLGRPLTDAGLQRRAQLPW